MKTRNEKQVERETIPEGYTGMYDQTQFIARERLGILYGVNLGAFILSKGAAPIHTRDSFSVVSSGDTKVAGRRIDDIIYFHPEFSVHLAYGPQETGSDYFLRVTQPVGTTNGILEDIERTFPELERLRTSRMGVRDPRRCKPCF